MNPYLDFYPAVYQTSTGKQYSLKHYQTQISTYADSSNEWGVVYAARCRNKRLQSDIMEFTGLMFIDVDKCKDHKAVKQLFTQIDCTVMTYYSRSGKNVHAVIKIPISKTVDEYKRRFRSFISEIDPYLKDIAILDTITANPIQLSFHSYDPDIYINKQARTYTGISDPFETRVVQIQHGNFRGHNWIINHVRTVIPQITSPGYTTLRDKSITLGGWCGAGIGRFDEVLSSLIQAVQLNQYFQSDESSGRMSDYIDIAEKGFNYGIERPLQWKF